MDVRAIVLLGEPGESKSHTAESIAGMPIALLPALGRPVVHHVAENLRRGGVESVRVISNACSASLSMEQHAQRDGLDWIRTPGEKIWKVAEESLIEFGQQGAEVVVLIRLGAYLEFNVDDLLQLHLDQNARVTRVAGKNGAYDYFAISASRRNDAAFLLRHKLRQTRIPSANFEALSYENPLSNAQDLHKLIRDSLSLKTQIVPNGRELRPGIWMGRGAKIERGARIVAPAYIGEKAVVRVAALVTRCSSVEHHAEIDCGTVIEDSSVLPFSYVGAGLEVAHSTIAFRQLTNHRRGITIEVVDPVLLDMVPGRSLTRFKNKLSALFGFLPERVSEQQGAVPPAEYERLSGTAQLTAAAPESSPAIEAGVSEGDLLRMYEGK